MIEPLVKELLVKVNTKRAFEMFTQDIGQWWPLASHSISAGDGKTARSVSMTPGVGGKIIEVMHDGQTATWGVITQWEAGKSLTFSWHLRRPESEQTLVSVKFMDHGAGAKVRLIHSGWEAQGDAAADNREHYNSGWDFVLAECYGNETVA